MSDQPAKIDKRKSPEHRQHLRDIGYKKGRPPTGGGTKKIPEEVKQALAERTPEAVEKMYDLMLNSSNPMVQFKAAEYFLSPFVSKAPTEQNVNVNHSHQIADMLSQINAMRLKDDRESRQTIDITPSKEDEKPPVRIIGEYTDV